MSPNGRRPSGLIASPVLVGGVTVLVAIVAVFLSYNANNGLPFVPTFNLTVNVPSSAGLVKGNEVRVGGQRVGRVTSITAVAHRNGAVSARLKLALDQSMQKIPRDSTLRVRPKSALGLKYVELTTGKSARDLPANARTPLSASSKRAVEIDDFFNMFDAPTRIASSDNLDEYGDAFAGRGPALNRTLAKLDPLVRELEPAMRNLSSRRTGFDRFFPALAQAADEAAPVAEIQASMFVALDGTFEALDGVKADIQATISGGPSALETATRELPAQRPFLASNEELFRRFRPSFASLSAAAPDLSEAFRLGIPALRGAPRLNRRFTRSFEALERFGNDRRVHPGLRRLARTADLAGPPVAFITPAQTTCNYLTLLLRNTQSSLSESDAVGSMLRVLPMSVAQLPGSEFGPAAVPANGPWFDPNNNANSLRKDSFLHSNPYPNTAAPGQPRECEAGNEPYLQRRKVIGNVPGNQSTKNQPTKRTLR
jgi:virulence factor Mce-like protein